MNFLRLVAFVLLISLWSAVAHAQRAGTVGQTILVVPFENQSKAPGIEWIGDSFPELLQERLNSPSLYVVPREDRMRAYDRVGIPVHLRASRATIYRIAEQLDVDFVVLGEYGFDGRVFTVHAQLLDMHRERLLPEMTESAPLTQLIDVETWLAWDILHSLHPELAISQSQYVAQAPPVRLDAFENYIRGVTADASDQQVHYFREAIRFSPNYSEAILQLGKALYRERQYAEAVSWLSRIPERDPRSGEASFCLGLAAYEQGDFAKAESAFNAAAAHLPLTEVYNNLGVVVDHRDPKSALQYFQRAVAEDPNQPDYRFNLGVEFCRTGNMTDCARQLREALSLHAEDNEARTLLETIPNSRPNKFPPERLRTSYDENSFRLLVLKIDAAAEQKLAKADPRTHSRFHSDRGRQLLGQGFMIEAEREFREAISLNPQNADAHAGLASALETQNNFAEARTEAEEALRWRQSAEPLLVLAQLDLRDNRTEAAAEEVDRALRLEPNSVSAQEMKRTLDARLARDAQSTAKP